jgi:hypothetical protein
MSSFDATTANCGITVDRIIVARILDMRESAILMGFRAILGAAISAAAHNEYGARKALVPISWLLIDYVVTQDYMIAKSLIYFDRFFRRCALRGATLTRFVRNCRINRRHKNF